LWLSCQLPEFIQGPSRSLLNCPNLDPSRDSEAVKYYHEQLLTYEKA
jgi:hypothetical protein